MERYKQLSVRPGSMLQCDVTHVDSPSCFYSQPVTSRSELDDLMDEIYTNCRRAPPLVVNQLRLQQVVMARYSEDQAWYRAEITGTLTVLLMHPVSMKLFNIKVLPIILCILLER